MFAALPSSYLRTLFPGFMVSVLVAATAQFLSEHYGAPAMLMALLLGLALNFLAEEGSPTAPGIAVTSRTVLRLGVALLGARISVDMLAGLGRADRAGHHRRSGDDRLRLRCGAVRGPQLALRASDRRFGGDLRGLGRDGDRRDPAAPRQIRA